MKENMTEKEKAIGCSTRGCKTYVQPQIEVCSTVLQQMITGSAGGGAGQAGEDPDIIDDNPFFGGGAAKQVILGKEFSFSDIWED